MRVIQAFAQEEETQEHFDKVNRANRDAHIAAMFGGNALTWKEQGTTRNAHVPVDMLDEVRSLIQGELFRQIEITES